MEVPTEAIGADEGAEVVIVIDATLAATEILLISMMTCVDQAGTITVVVGALVLDQDRLTMIDTTVPEAEAVAMIGMMTECETEAPAESGMEVASEHQARREPRANLQLPSSLRTSVTAALSLCSN